MGPNITDFGLNTEATPGLYDPSNPVLNENITATQDYIFNVWLYPVNKQQALDYLDNGGPIPPRYAKAIVVRGSVPDVMEYKVNFFRLLHLTATYICTPLHFNFLLHLTMMFVLLR